MNLQSKIFPVVTLYQPWATWIMRGWKTIETRTHNRFACLKGKEILIHAGQTTDENAIYNPYLTREQLLYAPDEVINGCVLGCVTVTDFRELDTSDSQEALIDCGSTKRFGLFLQKVILFDEPIPVKGEMGIWYFDLNTMQKVKKQTILKTPTLF